MNLKSPHTYLAALAIAVLCRPGGAAESSSVEFLRDVQPILADKCFRCHGRVPHLSDETDETMKRYGPDVHRRGSFAANCLLAQRMAERAVRFIQLYHRGWDQHYNLPCGSDGGLIGQVIESIGSGNWQVNGFG